MREFAENTIVFSEAAQLHSWKKFDGRLSTTIKLCQKQTRTCDWKLFALSVCHRDHPIDYWPVSRSDITATAALAPVLGRRRMFHMLHPRDQRKGAIAAVEFEGQRYGAGVSFFIGD